MSQANGDTAEYFAAVAEGRLVFQKCGHCGNVQFPPRYQCATCWETDLSWIESSGHGRVESFTIVRRAPLSAFRDMVPYVVASVKLEEGPRMITTLVGEDALETEIGDPVAVTFEAGAQGDVLPMFKRL